MEKSFTLYYSHPYYYQRQILEFLCKDILLVVMDLVILVQLQKPLINLWNILWKKLVFYC